MSDPSERLLSHNQVMAAKKRRWLNQYIERSATKADRIFVATKTAIAALHYKLRSYERSYGELGCGSGGHLIERAAADPGSAYVGFELRYKRSFRCIEKAEEQGVANLYVIRGDARLLKDVFQPETLAGVYLNFPDPWEKRRWLKHRLLTAEYLHDIHKTLSSGGFFSFKTDHPTYFAATLELVRKTELFSITKVSENLHSSVYATQNVCSEFEKLFISKAYPIYFLELKKL